MSKVLGVDRFEVEDVETVADVVAKAKVKVGPEFEKLTRVAAIAINGVLVSHKRGMKTRLADGDVVGFVKAAAGG
jgi:molybdopterin converting factor small subunit